MVSGATLDSVLAQTGRTTVDRSAPLACEADPDLFFPVGEDGPALRQMSRAKAVCFGCPQALACLVEGLGEDDGIWGGTTPQERRDLRRRLGALRRHLRRAADEKRSA